MVVWAHRRGSWFQPSTCIHGAWLPISMRWKKACVIAGWDTLEGTAFHFFGEKMGKGSDQLDSNNWRNMSPVPLDFKIFWEKYKKIQIYRKKNTVPLDCKICLGTGPYQYRLILEKTFHLSHLISRLFWEKDHSRIK